MGITFVHGTASNDDRAVELDFLVDSGAQYTLIPEPAWKALGLQPKRTQTFSLADGSTVERGISECFIRLAEGDGHSTVILGESDDEPLLGAVTLESLGLILDPFKRRLLPMSKLRL